MGVCNKAGWQSVCETERLSSLREWLARKPRKAVLFDADDTIWLDERYFHELRSSVLALFPASQRAAVGERLDIEGRAAEAGEAGYAAAVRRCCARLSLGQNTRAAIDVLLAAFARHEIELLPESAITIARIAAASRAVLYTKGVRSEQLRKLELSRLFPSFEAIRIVTAKDLATLTTEVASMDCVPRETLVIGNSVKHDIIPAVQLSLRSIWLNHSENFRGRNAALPEGVVECTSWKMVADLLWFEHHASLCCASALFCLSGEILRTNRDGVGLKILGAQTWKLDLSLSGGLPVQSSGTKREGMKDLPLVGEVGAVLKYDLFNSPSVQWQLRLPLRYASGFHLSGLQSVGWISDPGVWVSGDVSLLGARWDWGASVNVNFQNERFNNFYYGIGAADATPTRRRYSASGGYSGADLRAGVVRRIGGIVATGFVGMSNISGATFSNSPLVQQTTNFYAGVALFWVFDKSKEVATVINRGDMQ